MREFEEDADFRRHMADPGFARSMATLQGMRDRSWATARRVADLMARAREALEQDIPPARRAEIEAMIAKLRDMRSGLAPLDLDPDAPLSLMDAVHLPELGGEMTRDRKFWRPSASITVKTLRNALGKGLEPWQPNSKNIMVTRRRVRAWLEGKWHDRATPAPSSSSGLNAGTSGEGSPTKRLITSSGEAGNTSQAAAKALFRKLKSSSPSSS